jgi:E3 ubiquitin-protein ligase AIP2
LIYYCQGITAQPKVPPASKEVVANLPVVTVTEEIIARLGSETECAVCRENLVVDDKMQELPCKHLFHPPCLKPWLVKSPSYTLKTIALEEVLIITTLHS